MKIYTLHREQRLEKSVDEVWEFLSNPENLSRITPEEMDFKIVNMSIKNQTYAGQLISYRIGLFPGVRLNWLTEITHVNAPDYFVDEQRFGPYSFWHHQHILQEDEDGVTMIDEVNYAIPFGLIGQFIHWIFIKKKLNSIFNYRSDIIKKYL
ncbi:MAG: SRPBCC family protein [Cyclobacteriaceae bacterium]|nr:SRPBCC family protein [Cyclobacteriaceae bacterium]